MVASAGNNGNSTLMLSFWQEPLECFPPFWYHFKIRNKNVSPQT